MLALLMFLLCAPAWAGQDADQAEYTRLSEEMEKLAQKGAWTGVERTYQKVVELGVDMAFSDFVSGAHAARHRGDVTEARARLKAAVEIREDREVLDWLWDIDSNYGQVSIKTDPGTYELRIEQMPFEPDRAKAVQFAQTQMAEFGEFEGYLPEATYFIGEFELVVMPRVQAARVDLRTGEDVGRKPKPPKEPKPVKEPRPAETAVAEAKEPEPPREPKPPKEPKPIKEPRVKEPRPVKEPRVKEPKPPKEPGPARAASEVSPFLYLGPEAPPLSILVGAIGSWEWGAGFVYRFDTPEPRFAVAAGAGADLYDVLFGAAGQEVGVVFSAQVSGRFYPWGPLYLDATYGPLVWSDIVKAYYGPSAGAGLELGRTGPVSVDGNIGLGYAPNAYHNAEEGVDYRLAARYGLALSINF